MKKMFLIGAALSSLMAGSASAQLVAVKSLSVDMTVTMISTAATCAKSDKVTIAVVDRNQVLVASFRGPVATLNALDLARRKAATSAQFGRPNGDLAMPGGGRGGPAGGRGAAADAPPPSPELTAINTLATLVRNTATGELTLGGGLPIMVGDEIIGAIGLSGSGATEGPCAKAAIEAIQPMLK